MGGECLLTFFDTSNAMFWNETEMVLFFMNIY